MKFVISISTKALVITGLFVSIFSSVNAQAPAAKAGSDAGQTKAVVTKIDEKALVDLLKPKGRPLLINFWATWCGPCREEFPDLVKIDREYRGKIDFITITLDFEEELTTGVPKFLAEMKAEMPTYLLITPDESQAISLIAKDWKGGLPFTILFDQAGGIAYSHQGVVKLETMKTALNKLIPAQETK